MTENEKTTALIPSVGADGGQPPHNSTYQSIPHETCESNPPEENIEEMRKKIRRMNDPRYLHTVSMTELYQTAYKSRPPVIDGLLYSGAYILAGAPKIGKSFLVAQLAYHVSTGQRLWGYEVHQGTVLYLALEDDFQRIQSRMFMMYGVADTASLHFATAANKIGNGLDEQLENFIKEHPDTKLVILSLIHIRSWLSLTPCRRFGRPEARLTATPATMRSSASSSVLRTDTAFASLPSITQENSQPGTALKRSPAQQDFSVVQTEHS